jgi:hypothetical protein
MQWSFIFKFVSVGGPEPFASALDFTVFLLAIPGLIVAAIVAGNVHDYSPAVVVGASLVLYSMLTYWILSVLARRRL